jgi:hypothetical protein
MENNNTGQAANAVASVRALPWTVSSSTSWRSLPLTAELQVGTRSIACDSMSAMVGVTGYRMSGISATTIDRVAPVCLKGADHKFSTRLGPTASPPV